MPYPVSAARGRIVTPAAEAGGWWLAGGTIADAAVLEHVVTPTQGQYYLGAAVASGQPWTLAVRTNSIVSASNSGTKYIFSGYNNVPVLGMNNTNRGVYTGVWSNTDIFTDTSNHVFFIVSSGSSIQCYVDGTAVGSAISSDSGIASSGPSFRATWRSNSGPINALWPNAVQAGAVYSIAIDGTQRAALYPAMAAV